jgi:hypothetical protein
MAVRTLTSTKAVVDELGGYHAVAELTGSSSKAAENWRRFSTFPSKHFLVMSRALEKHNCRAPASLWGMTETERASA